MKEFYVHINYDGIVPIKANSKEEAEEKVREMTCDEMYGASDGTWDIGDVDESEEF